MGGHLRRKGRGSVHVGAISAKHVCLTMDHWCCAQMRICSPKVAISHRTMPNDHLRTTNCKME